jgi:hypothetical protein
MQKRTIERNVYFEKTIREFKNVVKKKLKIIEHVNIIILQNQSQFQSQSQSKKSTFSISSENDKSEKRQCSCDVMHDLKNYEHFMKFVKSSNWKCNSQKRKWVRDAIKKNWNLYHVFKKIANINILNDIKKEDCKWKSRKNKNDKKSDSEKTAEDNDSDVKFVNIISMKSFKYASLFIKKTFNNFLWRNVIYDLNYNDSFTYDLNRFVNEITFVHELINTSNDSMMIEKYETMFIINCINEKNRKRFFDNIVYVSFIDIILIFVTHFKKQDFE